MIYRSRISSSGLVVVEGGGEPCLVVGTPCDQAEMWAAWYAEHLCETGDGPPPWPYAGLQFFDSPDLLLFIFDGLPVGRAQWDGQRIAWVWNCLECSGRPYDQDDIPVDPEQVSSFLRERERIALKLGGNDDTIVDVLMAELNGRLRLFRDETRELVLMFGRSKARRIGLHRRSPV